MTKTSRGPVLSLNSAAGTFDLGVSILTWSYSMFCQRVRNARFFLLSAAVLIACFGAPVFAQQPGWTKHVSEADRARPNPEASDPAAVSAGQKLYSDKCAHCHGPNGEGKGHSPSLQTETVHSLTPGELEWVIAHGFSLHRMPSFESLSQDERWQIVAYVQSLPKAAK
jgi:mono/diheme cytochrome c family protein